MFELNYTRVLYNLYAKGRPILQKWWSRWVPHTNDSFLYNFYKDYLSLLFYNTQLLRKHSPQSTDIRFTPPTWHYIVIDIQANTLMHPLHAIQLTLRVIKTLTFCAVGIMLLDWMDLQKRRATHVKPVNYYFRLVFLPIAK